MSHSVISFNDLYLIFIVAILFVVMFRVQRRFFSKNYYELSRRVFGRGITIRMMLIRLLMVFIFSYGVYWLTDSASVVIVGVLLGSFLIVWPILLNPSTFDVSEVGGYNYNIVNISTKGWFFLLLSYVLFIISSGLIAFLSVGFGESLVNQTIESFKSWLLSYWWVFLVSIFFAKSSDKMETLLEKDILDREALLDEYNNDEE